MIYIFWPIWRRARLARLITLQCSYLYRILIGNIEPISGGGKVERFTEEEKPLLGLNLDKLILEI